MKTDYITNLETLRGAMLESSMLTALAMLAITGDQKDDISQNEAFKKYGSGWITDRERRGLIHSTRQSSKQNSAIIYSRFEIETLKRTEKLIQEEYSRLANMSDK